MTTLSIDQITALNRFRAKRLSRVAQMEWRNLTMGSAAVAAVIPFALLWSDDDWVRGIGVGYVLLYIGLMVVPTALEALLMYDALRVLMGRQAIVLPLV